MGVRYKHVTIDEGEMARLHSAGHSVRQIAALDRSPSTSRELKRNGSRTKGYEPVYAATSRARRWSGSRLERDADLRDQGPLSSNKAGLQIRLREGVVEGQDWVISHETIYRFIYAQLARTKDYSWRRLSAPQASRNDGWRGRKGGSPASFIHLRRPLAERPQDAADRRTPGHWEADLMLLTYGQAILTLHERHSRLLIALRPPGKASNPIASAMTQVLGAFPPQWRRRSPSTTGRSSPAITNSTPWASRPSSATLTRPGRREEWRCHRTHAPHSAPEDRPSGVV